MTFLQANYLLIEIKMFDNIISSEHRGLILFITEETMGDTITKNMTFGELVQKYPQVAPVLAEYGMHCIGCHIGISETIEEGARAHGLGQAEIDQMLVRLNAGIA